MTAGELPREPLTNATARRSIHAWERIERSGKVYFVALGEDMQPVSEIAVQDAGGIRSGRGHRSDQFLLVRNAGSTTISSGLGRESMEKIVVGAIRAMLKDGDATAYQVFQTLICGLDASTFGRDASVDVARLLEDNFWQYVAPAAGGLLVRKWTLDEERARRLDVRNKTLGLTPVAMEMEPFPVELMTSAYGMGTIVNVL